MSDTTDAGSVAMPDLTKSLPDLRAFAAFYRDGVARLRTGHIGTRAWIWTIALALAVIGDETTTGYMLRLGFREGNPAARAGFGSVGFAGFAIGSGLLLLVVIAPLLSARLPIPQMRLYRTLAYIAVIMKSLAVVNNLALFAGIWHGVLIRF